MKKESRKKWSILVMCIALCAVIGIVLYLSRYQRTSPERPENRYDASTAVYTSAVDQDGDGVDDQTDVLQCAVEYIAARPKYKSKYYSTGYPDDGYGVCTDVVAAALKGAGYDLMQLVQEDIKSNPEDYEIDEPDPNIDFRRVRNLKVYFEHTAIPLTSDVSQIEEWQGGDVVVFQNHIGIVSDRRNERGVPYVIHHNDPMQKNYEEDILEKRADITGHFRIS